MPVELSFTKHLKIEDLDLYINECCVGGDMVTSHLLPWVQARY